MLAPMETACSVEPPVEVSKLSGVTAVAGGDQSSARLGAARRRHGHGLGRATAPGSSATGQPRNGSDVPVPVKGLGESVTAVAAGANSASRCWKAARSWPGEPTAPGQLGDGTTTNSDVPVEVTGLSEEVTAIAAAATTHALALLNSGKVMAWGANGSGQLGNGTTKGSEVPRAQ